MARPFLLDPLFRSVRDLSGIGPRNAQAIERLTGGGRFLDLLWHLPIDIIDRNPVADIRQAESGQIVTVKLAIGKHSPSRTKSRPYRIACQNDDQPVSLIFFHANKAWLEKQLPENAVRIVSGKLEFYAGQPQIVHPDLIVKPDEESSIPKFEPVYPLTQGLTHKTLSKGIETALKTLPDMPEWLDPAYQKKQGWPVWNTAMKTVHQPERTKHLAPEDPARLRLAYDELLANQLTMALLRHRSRKKQGRVFDKRGTLSETLLHSLPFDLTGAQKRVLDEILQDMKAPLKMLRLLQGDVGSGKTIVAALAMTHAIENGAQAALMAPTEILARQHFEGLKPLLDTIGISCVILTGRDKGKAREQIISHIADGSANIVIGTHALFQQSIHFHDLGLAVIDEQHRFGVHQRLSLSEKGKGTDVLVMTATPIPRTLTLTTYGDMDVSRIDEKPPGRKPIDTRLIPQEKIEPFVESLQRKIAEGDRVYWVCPLIEESEKSDMAAAEARFDVLKHWLGDKVGLVHGRMKGEEKDAVMTRFAKGDLSVLVATTVIEVGVNVPEATIMVIEQAERFGLSQLHQLRGRVGRGGAQSYCFLIYSGPLGETARERLSVMRESEDGFLIAEKDLKLRGGGDILGTRQSGITQFQLAQLPEHSELLAAASDDARLIMDKDPGLETERGKALKTLLYLFSCDQAIRYLESG